MIALPTPQFVATVGACLTAAAPITPTEIAARIKRDAVIPDPTVAAMVDEVLEPVVFRTVLALCLSRVVEAHGAEPETGDRIIAALLRGERGPTFADLAAELHVERGVLCADFEAAYADATGEHIKPMAVH